jgi:hypothetical protein
LVNYQPDDQPPVQLASVEPMPVRLRLPKRSTRRSGHRVGGGATFKVTHQACGTAVSAPIANLCARAGKAGEVSKTDTPTTCKKSHGGAMITVILPMERAEAPGRTAGEGAHGGRIIPQQDSRRVAARRDRRPLLKPVTNSQSSSRSAHGD